MLRSKLLLSSLILLMLYCLSCSGEKGTSSENCNFTVSEPTAGSSWIVGGVRTIKWTSTGAGANVKLELYKGPTLKCVIAEKTPNNGSFAWTVDDCGAGTASDFVIKVSDTDNSACAAKSSSFPIVMPCALTVSSPDAQAIWTKGAEHTIRWTSSNAGTTVKIELLQGATLICQIAPATANDGAYAWIVDECGRGAGSDYAIRISDVLDVNCTSTSNEFAIDLPCNFVVTSPSSSTTWTTGSIHDIEWTSTGASANSKIELLKGSVMICVIAESVPNSGAYSWTVNDCDGGTGTDYSIRISDAGNASCNSASGSFGIDVPCEFTVTSPTAAVNWSKGSVQAIQWTSVGNVGSVKIELVKGVNTVCVISASTPNTGVLYWEVDDCGAGAGSDFAVRISDVNNANCASVSNGFEIIVPCNFEITSPTTNPTWIIGSNQIIQWTSSGAGPYASLGLYKGTDFICWISASTSNDGEFTWVVEDCGFGTDSDYYIAVWDAENVDCYGVSSYVSISPPCSISILSPSSLSVWPKDSPQTLTWTTSGFSDSVMIELYKATNFVGTLASSFFNGGTAFWLSVDDFGYGAGTDYRIKITDVKNPSCFGFSDYFEIWMAPPCIYTITSPSYSSNWTTGSTRNILWTSTGTTRCDIDLYKGDWFICQIASDTYNDGSHSWVVDDCDGGTGSDYRVRIVDGFEATCYTYSDYFAITKVCNISVNSPSLLDEWDAGTSKTITWNHTGASTFVKLDLYNYSIFLCTIASSTLNDGSFVWTVDDCGEGTDGNFRVKVSDAIDGTCYDFSDYFKINVPCFVTVTDPGASTSWTTGNLETIRWSTSGASSNVKIELYKGSYRQSIITSFTGNDGSHLWFVSDSFGGSGSDYRIKVTDADNSGCYDFSPYFTIIKE